MPNGGGITISGLSSGDPNTVQLDNGVVNAAFGALAIGTAIGVLDQAYGSTVIGRGVQNGDTIGTVDAGKTSQVIGFGVTNVAQNAILIGNSNVNLNKPVDGANFAQIGHSITVDSAPGSSDVYCLGKSIAVTGCNGLLAAGSTQTLTNMTNCTVLGGISTSSICQRTFIAGNAVNVANSDDTVAIGATVVCEADNSVLIGHNQNLSELGNAGTPDACVVVGHNNFVTTSAASGAGTGELREIICVGTNNSIAVGAGGDDITKTIVLGHSNTISANAGPAQNNIIVGNSITVAADVEDTVSIGGSFTNSNSFSTLIGNRNVPTLRLADPLVGTMMYHVVSLSDNNATITPTIAQLAGGEIRSANGGDVTLDLSGITAIDLSSHPAFAPALPGMVVSCDLIAVNAATRWLAIDGGLGTNTTGIRTAGAAVAGFSRILRIKCVAVNDWNFDFI